MVRIAVEPIKQLLAKAPGSIKGQVDLKEMARSIATAVSGGGIVGLLILVLTAVSTNAAAIFPNPLTASLATFGIGLVVDLLRRQADGVVPVNLPAGVPVDVPGTFVAAGGITPTLLAPALGPIPDGAVRWRKPSGPGVGKLGPLTVGPAERTTIAKVPDGPMTGPAGVVR